VVEEALIEKKKDNFFIKIKDFIKKIFGKWMETICWKLSKNMIFCF
jgi:hypothetical protein